MAIKKNGVNGYYVFLGKGIEVSNGMIVNEVRLKSRSFGIEFLEKGTNRCVSSLSKKDIEKIYDAM
jgi:hypothetical protein